MFGFFNKLSAKQKKGFFIISCFGIIVLIYPVLIRPALSRIEEIQIGIEDVKAKMAEEQLILDTEDKIIRESQAFVKYVPNKLKDDDEINSELFATIEAVAQQSEINLIKSNPSRTKNEEGYVEYYANLDVAGSLEKVIGFMHALNSSEELFKVVKFDMSPRRGVEGEIQTALTVVKLIIKPDLK